MKCIEMIRDDKVFVFKDDKMFKCTKEDNRKFFDCEIDKYIDEYINVLNSDLVNLITKENSSITCYRIVKIIVTSLFIIVNPSNVFALEVVRNSLSILDEVCHIVMVGANIVTVLRLINLVGIGYTEHRLQVILRDYLEVVLATVLIPNLRTIMSLFFN